MKAIYLIRRNLDLTMVLFVRTTRTHITCGGDRASQSIRSSASVPVESNIRCCATTLHSHCTSIKQRGLTPIVLANQASEGRLLLFRDSSYRQQNSSTLSPFRIYCSKLES
jgi:hypothetical protein